VKSRPSGEVAQNHRIERTGPRVPVCHAPGLRQPRAREARAAPPLIRSVLPDQGVS